jgi:hypothetical protein
VVGTEKEGKGGGVGMQTSALWAAALKVETCGGHSARGGGSLSSYEADGGRGGAVESGGASITQC